jgi:hypothetical protein
LKDSEEETDKDTFDTKLLQCCLQSFKVTALSNAKKESFAREEDRTRKRRKIEKKEEDYCALLGFFIDVTNVKASNTETSP